MLRQIPARLFAEWTIYAELEPFGEERADIRTSTLLQLLTNVYRDRKRHKTPFALDEFVLRIGDAAPPPPTRTAQTAQEKFDALKMMLLAHTAAGRPKRPPSRRK